MNNYIKTEKRYPGSFEEDEVLETKIERFINWIKCLLGFHNSELVHDQFENNKNPSQYISVCKNCHKGLIEVTRTDDNQKYGVIEITKFPIIHPMDINLTSEMMNRLHNGSSKIKLHQIYAVRERAGSRDTREVIRVYDEQGNYIAQSKAYPTDKWIRFKIEGYLISGRQVEFFSPGRDVFYNPDHKPSVFSLIRPFVTHDKSEIVIICVCNEKPMPEKKEFSEDYKPVPMKLENK